MGKKYYVTATDKFMSGWGRAKDKINKVVIECDNYDEADRIESKLMEREEMKYVNISSNKPYYNVNTHVTTYVTKDNELHQLWYR